MVVNLEQGSKEWLEYRRTKFNASETPILFNKGFMSIEKLAKVKLGLEPSYLEILQEKKYKTDREHKILNAVKKGQITEKTIRDTINAQYGTKFEPIVLTDDDDERFSASLDGLDGDVVLEIKTSFNTWEHLMKRNGEIPATYIYQCYHQLMVSKAKKLLFVAGFINNDFELKLASGLIEANKDKFNLIRLKWENFSNKYLCFN